MAGQHNNEEPELIETIITELDSSTFALALIGGAIIGGFLLYMYMARDKFAKPVKQVEEEGVDEDMLTRLAHRIVDERLEIQKQEASAQENDEDSEQATDSPWAPPAFMQSQG